MIKIEKLNETKPVFDIKVDKNENFFANGILVHNCQEITLPTTPLNHIDDADETESEIALCVLAAINAGIIKDFSELEVICENAVRMGDFVVENQDYPVNAAKKMLKRRSLGIGITNLAYFLAKNNLSYDDPAAIDLVDELMEHVQYYCIKASVKLAKEYGKCEWFHKTKYADGIFPIDTYNKNVDKISKRKFSLDWDSLRKDVLQYGMRNSALTAMMPCESSSVVTNSTNGLEPARALITTKKSKKGTVKFVLPELAKLKNKYTLSYDLKDNKGLMNIYSVIQKYVDQGISANHYYDMTKYPDKNLPLSDVAKDILYFYQMGGKQIYYSNTYDGKSDSFEESEKNAKFAEQENKLENKEEVTDCEGGACSI